MKPRKRISAISQRQKQRNVLYRAARAESKKTAGKYCPVMLIIRGRLVRVKDVHHIFGKIGPLYWWIPGFLWVSREGHNWIDDNKNEARKHGWLAPLGQWNNTKLCTTENPQPNTKGK